MLFRQERCTSTDRTRLSSLWFGNCSWVCCRWLSCSLSVNGKFSHQWYLFRVSDCRNSMFWEHGSPCSMFQTFLIRTFPRNVAWWNCAPCAVLTVAYHGARAGVTEVWGFRVWLRRVFAVLQLYVWWPSGYSRKSRDCTSCFGTSPRPLQPSGSRVSVSPSRRKL